MKVKLDFEDWMDNLMDLAILEYDFSLESAKSFDRNAWKLYYDEDYSPRDALEEDLSYM